MEKACDGVRPKRRKRKKVEKRIGTEEKKEELK